MLDTVESAHLLLNISSPMRVLHAFNYTRTSASFPGAIGRGNAQGAMWVVRFCERPVDLAAVMADNNSVSKSET